jgi:hypothetical protein
MAITDVFAGVAVADYDPAVMWYERLFGRPPDVIVKEDEAMWQAADTGWTYLVADPDRASKALVTLLVEDLEKLVAELAEVVPAAIVMRPRVRRKTVITDPDGTGSPLARTLPQTTESRSALDSHAAPVNVD